MAAKNGNYTFETVINSLHKKDRIMVEQLHTKAVGWGYVPAISAMGNKPNDWKLEYKNKKSILYIMRIANNQWSVRCKLFNISQYTDILEQCNTHCIETLISNAKDCGNHGGACKGPVSFVFRGENYTKCRHYLLFTDIHDEDTNSIIRLLECENSFIKPKDSALHLVETVE